jgi:hypothetical protein
MTHQNDYTFTPNLIEYLLSNGLDGLPELLRVFLITAMQVEREKYLQASEH